MSVVHLALIPGVSMIIVGCASALYWRAATRERFRWLWIGAGLWAVAVALKVAIAIASQEPILKAMETGLPRTLYIASGGLYIGFQSSLTEIGLTLLACLVWRQLGADAKRATGIGVGAGAFEAILLGCSSTISILVLLTGMPGTEGVRAGIEAQAAVTPVFWMVAPIERILAILCHTSSRALVLLGAAHRRPMMVCYGFVLFMLLDGVAGVAHLAGLVQSISLWWIELAILPFAIVSVPIIRHCYARWSQPDAEAQDIPGPDEQACSGMES